MIIYTSITCKPCKELKEQLKGYDVQPEYVTLPNPEVDHAALGIRTVPTMIHGNYFRSGYDNIIGYIQENYEEV
ncbi:glutaredoxin [Pseudoalteromonas phage RIO-1]|uniref:Glutaredoxin n=1 Tax=Pseudoalteromonas phage RIO-1 TaxID=1316739 RepID=R4JMY3_9CAUD|nr:glutaredoxin [Pseudoalteromonas phage RIO-1]AGK87030.1 glutaredoxin [Pseudoalteromonas phage RIO-1]